MSDSNHIISLFDELKKKLAIINLEIPSKRAILMENLNTIKNISERQQIVQTIREYFTWASEKAQEAAVVFETVEKLIRDTEKEVEFNVNAPITALDALLRIESIRMQRTLLMQLLLEKVKKQFPDEVKEHKKSIAADRISILMCISVLKDFIQRMRAYESLSISDVNEGTYNVNTFWSEREASNMDTGSYFYKMERGSIRKCRVGRKNAQHVYYYPMNQSGRILFNDNGAILYNLKPTDKVFVSSESETDLQSVFDD